jgi:hypothetical protein
LFLLEFEHSLENETLILSHQLAMRKIAMNSYNHYHHSISVPLSINKQQTTSRHLRQNINSSPQLNSYDHINDENKISLISTKKYLWDRSASKDG